VTSHSARDIGYLVTAQSHLHSCVLQSRIHPVLNELIENVGLNK